MQLTSRDLYRLRRAHLLAQRATLRAQFAQHQLQELSLDLERRYGLLTRQAVLDVQTGTITLPLAAANGSQTHDIAETEIPSFTSALVPPEVEHSKEGVETKEEVTCGSADYADQSAP